MLVNQFSEFVRSIPAIESSFRGVSEGFDMCWIESVFEHNVDDVEVLVNKLAEKSDHDW